MLLAMLAALSAAPVDATLMEEAHRPMMVLKTNAQQPVGLTPAQVRHMYGTDQISNQGDGQIIGIVDGYDYPSAEEDLKTFSDAFGLPECSVASGCLTIVYASGTKPPANKGWSGETSLDLQWAHAIAPNAKLLLVEGANGNNMTLLKAVPVAVANGATTINMSWGTNHEFASEQSYDSQFFSNPRVTYFNASGDSGNNLFGYPGASSIVVGCGGTQVKLNSSNDITSEVAWSGSGGGVSLYVKEPSYQLAAQSSGMRGVPDVAYNASPASGFAVYNSQTGTTKTGHWGAVGGTSAASPQWSALTAIANSLRAQAGKPTIGNGFLPAVYANPSVFNDITSGTNGSCGADCTAHAGYDFVTGLGSPMAPSVVSVLVNAP